LLLSHGPEAESGLSGSLCTLGLAIQALGRPGDAVAHFRRALELRPDFAQAHRDLAMVLRELASTMMRSSTFAAPSS